MSIWRPSTAIVVKALGIAWRGDAILASEILDDGGQVKGVRPLGGTVEYSETWQEALLREFKEELGAEIILTGEPEVIENIYTHHGVTGHEIIFISNIFFVDQDLYNKDDIRFSEHDGTSHLARWFELEALERSEPELYPAFLLPKLKEQIKNNTRPKFL